MKTRIASVLAVGALTGCFGPTTPDATSIEVRDNSVLLPVVRIGGNFVREKDTPASYAQGGHGVELGLTQTSGDGTQSFGAGQQPVVFGGRTFVPAGQLRHEFDFAFYDLSYRYRHYFSPDRTFGIEALAGVGAVKVDFTVTSAAQTARESLDSTGLTGSFGLVWRFRPSTSLQSRLMLYGSGDSGGISTAERADVYLVQALGHNVALRAGYAYWQAETDRSSPSRSDVKLRFSGPALGLDVAF